MPSAKTGIRRVQVLFLVILVSFSGIGRCEEGVSVETDSQTLVALLNDFNEAFLRMHPRVATSLGDNRYNDRFENNISVAHRTRYASMLREFQARAAKIQRDRLSDDEQFNLLIFDNLVRTEREGLRYPEHLLPLDQMNCLPAEFAEWGTGQSTHPFHTVKDYDDFLKRMDGFVSWVDTAIANMRAGVEQQVVLSARIAKRTIERLKEVAPDKPEKSLFYGCIDNMPADVDKAAGKRLKQAYAHAIRNKLAPAFNRLIRFMEQEYLPHCREDLAWSSLPDGQNWYAYRIRAYTTSDLSPEEIFQLGQQEVSRIVKQIQKISGEISPGQPIRQYTSKNQLVHAYQRLMTRVVPRLHDHFGITIETPMEIRTTDRVSHYRPGTRDGSRPGVFYVYADDLRRWPVVVNEPLFLHEAVPGHHFQLSVQRESNLPAFRQWTFYGAYVEGWALYVERFGGDLGLYRDSRQQLWQLRSELWRALRLILDVGIHAGGWSVDDALTHIKPYGYGNGMVREIERYAAWPAQALTYKIGELRILALREKAEKALGPEFELAAFHREILLTGPVPLNLLELHMDRWIDSRKQKFGSPENP